MSSRQSTSPPQFQQQQELPPQLEKVTEENEETGVKRDSTLQQADISDDSFHEGIYEQQQYLQSNQQQKRQGKDMKIESFEDFDDEEDQFEKTESKCLMYSHELLMKSRDCSSFDTEDILDGVLDAEQQ